MSLTQSSNNILKLAPLCKMSTLRLFTHFDGLFLEQIFNAEHVRLEGLQLEPQKDQ